MSALSAALESSQAKAVAALGKAYVRRDDEPDDELFAGLLHKIGLDDDVAIAFLLAAWSVLREEKAPPPAEPGWAGVNAAAAKKPAPSSPAQHNYIGKLMDDGGHVRLEHGTLVSMTWDTASALIDKLKAGTYKAEPF